MCSVGVVWRWLPGVALLCVAVVIAFAAFTSSGLLLLRPAQSLPVMSTASGGHASGVITDVQQAWHWSVASEGAFDSKDTALLLIGRAAPLEVLSGGEALSRRSPDGLLLREAAIGEVWQFVHGGSRMPLDQLVIIGTEQPIAVLAGSRAELFQYAKWINWLLVDLAFVWGLIGLSTVCVTALVWVRSDFQPLWRDITLVSAAMSAAVVYEWLPNTQGLLFVWLDAAIFYSLVLALCVWSWCACGKTLGQSGQRQLLSLMGLLAFLTAVDEGWLHLGLTPWLKTIAASMIPLLAWWRLPRSATLRQRFCIWGFAAFAFVTFVSSAGWSSVLVDSRIATWGMVGFGSLQASSGVHFLLVPWWLGAVYHIAQLASVSSQPEGKSTQLALGLQNQDIQQRLLFNAQLHRERLEAASLERQRIQRDLHDGVGSKLVAMLYAVRSGALAQAPLEEAVMSSIAAIKRLMRTESAPESREIVEAMFGYCFEMDGLLSDTAVNLVYEIQDDCPMSLIGSTTNDLIQIIRELIANSLKHSGARRIDIRLEVVETFLRVLIEESEYQDNSAMFQDGLRRTISSGQGISNLRDRAAELGLRLWTDTQKDNRITYLVLRLCKFNQD